MIVRGGRSGKRYHNIISLIAIIITMMTMRYLVTTNNNIPAINVASEMVHQSIDQPDADACCVMCSTPNDSCCLKCNDVSSTGEQDIVMAMMEGLTHHIMEKHSSKISPWMKTRAWEGNSHIGNRKEQAVFYYDWMKSLTGGDDKFRHVCEIGMNGGHSALIFLAALNAHNDKKGIKLTMFTWQHSTIQKQRGNTLKRCILTNSLYTKEILLCQCLNGRLRTLKNVMFFL